MLHGVGVSNRNGNCVSHLNVNSMDNIRAFFLLELSVRPRVPKIPLKQKCGSHLYS